MLQYTDQKPIITCSTGNSGNSAIAVLRLSGFSSFKSIESFFSVKKVKARFNHFSKLLAKDGKVLDEIIFSYYPAPHSYTGENVLEISVHGNVLSVQRIIKMFCDHGFREALPGEFTFRALQNNKLSLSQVEGLDLLLNSSSSMAFNQGLELLHGELHQNYLELYESLIKLKAHFELMIDFSEDIGEKEGWELFEKALVVFKSNISKLYSRSLANHSSLLNPKVVLLGETNAGKSTLFNRLLNFNRSIVSSIAGTTRDYVSEPLQVGDTVYSLFDTAGIRRTSDEIEEEGIVRALKIVEESFFRILMINPFETTEENLSRSLEFKLDVVIFSHADLPHFSNEITKFLNVFDHAKKVFCYSDKAQIFYEIFAKNISGPIGPTSDFSGPIEPKIVKNGPIEPQFLENGPIGPTAPMGPGVKASGPIEPAMLKTGPIEPVAVVLTLLQEKFQALSSANPIFIERHRQAINNIYLATLDLESNFRHLGDVGILSSDISRLEASTKELVGYITPDSVLNSIFSNFCIGK